MILSNKVGIPRLLHADGRQRREMGNTDETCPKTSHLYNREQRQYSQPGLDQTQGHVCQGTVGTCTTDCETRSLDEHSPNHHKRTQTHYQACTEQWSPHGYANLNF